MSSTAELNHKLENALTAKQESEAKVTSLETKVKEYETEIGQLKEKVRFLLPRKNIKKALGIFDEDQREMSQEKPSEKLRCYMRQRKKKDIIVAVNQQILPYCRDANSRF